MIFAYLFSFSHSSSIIVANATFTYSVENLSRNQFEIRTADMVYNFQAASQDAMFQWIAALQVHE